MRRQALTITLCLLLISAGSVTLIAGTATAQSEGNSASYSVTYNAETGESTVEAEITVTESQEYADWTVTWIVPSDAKIKSVKSTQGDAEYERSGSNIKLEESDGDPRSSETFYIEYTTTTELQSKSDYFGSAGFTYSGFSDSPVEVTIDIVNGTPLNVVEYNNQDVTVNDSTITVSKNGPIAFTANIKPANTPEPTATTEHFTIFSETEDIDEAQYEDAYKTAVQALGHHSNYNTIPVVIMETDSYENQFGTETSGKFTSGSIYVNDDGDTSNYITLSHETAHAINAYQIGITPNWFNEGTAQLAETIARDKAGQDQEQFTTYDQLEQYNNQNKTWVYSQNWDATSTFAYEYTEIRFNNYVQTNGLDGFWESYSKLAESDKTQFSTSDITQISGIETKQMCDVNAHEQCADELMKFIPEYSQSTPSAETETPTTTEPTQTETPTSTTTETETTTTPTTTQTPTTEPTVTPSDESGESLPEWLEPILELLQWVLEVIGESLEQILNDLNNQLESA